MILNVDQILSAVSLEDIIRDYVDLKREGANLKGLSPFQDEKTASFVYSPTKDIYKCFSSGKGGNNAAKFLMDINPALTFPEAIEKIAAKTNIPLEYDSGNFEKYKEEKRAERDTKKALFRVMNEAFEVLSAQSERRQDYGGKKWTDQIIEKFGVVTVGNNKPLTNSKIDFHLLEMCGMVREKDGRKYDFFFNRVLYPIWDEYGKNILAYTGRAFDWQRGDTFPKYLNNADSLIYRKSKILFGFSQSAKSIIERGFTYLVEGATDVMALHQIGITNVVAICGTAFTLDQAKLLATITSHVIHIPDNDPAGEKSISAVTEILVKAQIQSSVLKINHGNDRVKDVYDLIENDEMDSEDWKLYSDQHREDGVLLFCTYKIGDKKDPFESALAVDTSAILLSKMKDKTVVSSYVKQLSKLIGSTQKDINDKIAERDKKESRAELDHEQEKDKKLFGVYVMGNRYLNANDRVISDFKIESIYLIKDLEKSRRIIKLTNYKGESITLEVSQKDFVSLSEFRVLTEGEGSYTFFGDSDSYIQIRRRLYEKSGPKVQLVDIYGFNKRSGCIILSNGLIDPEGEFIPIDEYGVANYRDSYFYMKAFSCIAQEGYLDDSDSDFDKSYIYPETIPPGCPQDFKTWSKEFARIWGNTGIIPMCFILGTVFREIVKKRYSGTFPLLNLFGPTNAGKSQLSDMVSCMFHAYQAPTHCHTSTNSAFFRKVGQAVNDILHYEEYRDDLLMERREGFKSMFEGFTRDLSIKGSKTATGSTPVRRSIMYTGQSLPGGDPALVNRSITVSLKKVEISADLERDSDQLRAWAKKGYLVKVTAELHSHRSAFEEKFIEIVDQAKTILKEKIDSESRIDPRIINNYTLMLGAYMATSLVMKSSPYKIEDVINYMVARIYDQVRHTESAEETSQFWDVVEHLIQTGTIPAERFDLQYKNEESFNDEKTKKTVLKRFDGYRDLLYLNLNFAYGEYAQSRIIQGQKISKGNVRSYLRDSPAFLGVKKSHKCSGTVNRVWVFDLAELPHHDFGAPYRGKSEDPFDSDNDISLFKNMPKVDDPGAGMDRVDPSEEDPLFSK